MSTETFRSLNMYICWKQKFTRYIFFICRAVAAIACNWKKKNTKKANFLAIQHFGDNDMLQSGPNVCYHCIQTHIALFPCRLCASYQIIDISASVHSQCTTFKISMGKYFTSRTHSEFFGQQQREREREEGREKKKIRELYLLTLLLVFVCYQRMPKTRFRKHRPISYNPTIFKIVCKCVMNAKPDLKTSFLISQQKNHKNFSHCFFFSSVAPICKVCAKKRRRRTNAGK